MIENHGRALIFHAWVGVKDEPDQFQHILMLFCSDLVVINHAVYFYTHFSGMTVLFARHSEDATLNEFLLAV